MLCNMLKIQDGVALIEIPNYRSVTEVFPGSIQ